MKIETVTEYVSRDGKRFRNEEVCRQYETELDLVEPIMNQLPKSNIRHGEYIQHHPPMLRKIKADIWMLILEKHEKEFPRWKDSKADEVAIMSIVGRIMSEYDTPIANAWTKLSRFNFDLGREYDQPYFANHPEEATEAK